MQFKSLSYGHFPLNLLGMSARRPWVRAFTRAPAVPAGVRRSGPQGGAGGPDPPPTVTASVPRPPGRWPVAGAA